MPKKMKEVTVQIPEDLYHWLDQAKTGKGELRDSLEKEILYRLHHSRDLGDVQRGLPISLRDTSDHTLILQVGEYTFAKMHYVGPQTDAAGNPAESKRWALRMGVRAPGQVTYVQGPREGLARIRAELPRLFLYWVAEETKDLNPDAPMHAVVIAEFFDKALTDYEVNRLDRQTNGLDYLSGLSLPF